MRVLSWRPLNLASLERTTTHHDSPGGSMSFSLKLVSHDPSGIALITAEGEATARDFPTYNDVHFDNILGPTWDSARVILDMDRVNYIDSAAIGWLLATHKSFRAGGGKIALHSLQPQVRQLLE